MKGQRRQSKHRYNAETQNTLLEWAVRQVAEDHIVNIENIQHKTSIYMKYFT